MFRINYSRGGPSWLLGLAVACATTATAQTSLYTFNGAGINDRLGVAVAAAGDVNGDSYPDLIVGATEDFNIFAMQPGYARVYSGLDGSVLLDLNSAGSGASGELFGAAVDGVGDVDSDGFGDVIVGVPRDGSNGNSSGAAYVFSGQNGQLLHTILGVSTGYRAGAAVSGAGDANNDGIPDFAVGMPGASVNGANSGLVRVYSGISGVLLFEVLGQAIGERLGVSLDALGDVDGNGFDDILVGSYAAGAQILSGVDGSLIRSFTASSTSDYLGIAVRGIGDVTGDSVPDVIVGAIQPTVFLPGGSGYALVLDSATGAEIHRFDGVSAGDRFGVDVDIAGDYNGDGQMDYLVGSEPSSTSSAGYVQVLSGSDGALIATLVSPSSSSTYGLALAYLGDINGDGTEEFAVSDPQESSLMLAAGRLTVESGVGNTCGSPSNYCTALPNSTGFPASISFLGSNSKFSNDLFLISTGLPPNQLGIFYYGAGMDSVPLGNGLRCVANPGYRMPVTHIGASGTTAWMFDNNALPNPSPPITSGSTWYFQFWYRDPLAGGASMNFSVALKIPFCP